MRKEKPVRGSTPAPDHIMQSFCGDPRYEIAVTWRTSTDVSEGYLTYQAVWGGPMYQVKAVSRLFVSDIDESFIHTAVAKNLTPGTRYKYFVGTDEYRNGEFYFETQPEYCERFRFLVVADQQNDTPSCRPDYEPFRRALEQALQRHPGCRFILTVGDNVGDGQNERQWNGYFHGLRGISENIPLMMTTGNHDNRGYETYEPGNKTGKFYRQHADFFDEQFALAYPQNGFAGFETENYSFDYGNVHFTVLGVNRFDLIAQWAKEDLLASDKRWKIATFHYPLFPVQPEAVTGLYFSRLDLALEEGGADVCFAGHEHSLARTYPIRNFEMFDRPSQGVIHYIMGNTGANIYCSNARKVWHPYFYPQEERVSQYSVVDVAPDTLTITAYLDDGRLIDRLVIDKKNDTIDPPAPAPIYHKTKMAFKGDVLVMPTRRVSAHNVDGKWFVPFGQVALGIGALSEKRPGQVRIGLYGKEAVFTEGSDVAETPEGPVQLSSPVYRGDRGHLYMPLDDVMSLFNMRYVYAARNNLLVFDYRSDLPVAPQP